MSININQILEKTENHPADYPIDYLLEKTEIAGLSFVLRPGVFIPREETEYLVKQMQQAKIGQKSFFSKTERACLKSLNAAVDLGAGSGFIGLSLSQCFQKVYLVEKSPAAFKYLQINQVLNKKITKNTVLIKAKSFSSGRLQNFLLTRNHNWLLVCNPPYVPTSDKLHKQKLRVHHEPQQAIYSGPDGLSMFKQIISFFYDNNALVPILAIFELDPRNIHKAKLLAQKIFSKISIKKDENNFDRFLICLI